MAHPLDPLSVEDVNLVCDFVKKDIFPAKGFILYTKDVIANKSDQPFAKFITVNLHEPKKELVLNFKQGDTWDRQALIILFYVRPVESTENISSDKPRYGAIECIVSTGTQNESDTSLFSWEELPGVNPNICEDEFGRVEELVMANEEFRAAMEKRGLTDPSMWMAEPWSCGYFEKPESGRIVRAQTWVRMDHPKDNGYAHPVDGLVAVVDLVEDRVIRIEEHHDEIRPVPKESCNYGSDFQEKFRDSVKPLDILQPEGVSFNINGNLIEWEKWSFRVGWNMREGLTLHHICYNDNGNVRPIFYRLAISEMVVPYGSPSTLHSRKNAFDLGEYGLGMLSNSLQLGCDCLGEIRYFHGYGINSAGEARKLPNVVCLHEEDFGVLWKHMDWRFGDSYVESRRSRRFVISMFTTVGNYEYGFYYYFYQDGTIEVEVKHSGIVNTSADTDSRYSTPVGNGDNLTAQMHQHFYSLRIDPIVDGVNNQVVEVNARAEDDDKNPYKNAFIAEETVLKTELQAQRDINAETARHWKIESSEAKNRFGKPTAWKIVPHRNCFPYAKHDSWLMRRATFLRHHLWVTPFVDDFHELYPAGYYPYQSNGTLDNGLAAISSTDRDVYGKDIVVWYTFGMHHIVRPEDFPVMPMEYLRVSLKPNGFFDKNPALDIPATCSKTSRGCAAE
mmetsp:Transcript_131840/g.196487  ORF Transcript_131840/g.196487 Transcript_131840/m.196487 type:complete len:675 (+) Transcript_131840:26-2050(+)|eukprot:CAMPEP_0117013280 /NCGR_PEP_ID=MMETSP0472-20121206/10991_1 /TAXON_ID=693140 ORGANISM="Tiarina fusus, Strain LIS" /NCGR_SAMPLE_ID=MMETSP0472 /ASSEMBLY_ACC=CAM_ASM_000603 /LENGTH=674 /DNA_ID=CAMNT_0004716553 /DNA_START=25 /DNA_END=2049 /DNA_ORIENTATION=-